MTRKQALIAPIGIIFLMLVFFVNSSRSAGLPEDGQKRLNAYLDEYSAGDRPEYQANKAENPQAFQEEMSGATYGDSVYFLTNDNIGQDVSTSIIKDNTANSLRPVPFPPVELWCIQLIEKNKPTSYIFLGLYSDLYNADWLIHMPKIDNIDQTLPQIGCPPLI